MTYRISPEHGILPENTALSIRSSKLLNRLIGPQPKRFIDNRKLQVENQGNFILSESELIGWFYLADYEMKKKDVLLIVRVEGEGS